ncbi:MAG: HEAT repeat domain-containing protein [Planctomycetota bacterium]
MAPRAVLSLALICWLIPASFAEVIHTTDGRSHVGSILKEGDPLTLRTLAGPLELAQEEILTIEGRSELMRSLRASQRRLQAGDWSGALRLSEWALRKGLFEAALDLADQALGIASRRDERPAVELPDTLLALPPGGFAEMDLPEAELAWKLLGHAAGESPSRALIASQRLQRMSERSLLTDTLLRGMNDPRIAFRRASVKLLGASHPEETIERVIDCMLFDRDETVRREACRAVKAYRNEGVVYPLVRALSQDRPDLRLAAMDAIGMLEERRAVGALIRHMRRADGSGKTRNHIAVTTQTSIVSDFDVEIAQASVIADPIVDVVKSGTVLDVGVAGVYERAIPRGEIVRVGALLETLTGETFGTDVQAWERWLGEQQGGP